MDHQATANNMDVSQGLAAILAQIQALGDRLAQVEQRRAAVENIPVPQDTMEQSDFGEAPYSYDIAPKPPDHLAGIPRRSSQHVQHKPGYNDPLNYNPTVFAGSCNPHAFPAWVRSMEELFDKYNYPEAKKVEIATNQLKGDAKFWWSMETTRRRHYNPTSSWTKMKNYMKKKYVPPGFPEQEVIIPKKVINQKAKGNKSISNQSNWNEPQSEPSREDVQVSNIKVKSDLDDNSIIPFMASIMHLPLSKDFETGSGIKEKLMDETLSGKEDLTKQMEVMVHKPTLDTLSSLLLVKEPTLTPKLHAYPSQTAQQDETKVRPTPHGDKEHAKERDSFVKEGQLVIQANQMDSGRVDPNISVESSHHLPTSYSNPMIESLKPQVNEGDQNVTKEPQHTFKLAFKPNQNQGVLYSLLIKEAAMGSFNTNPYDHKGYKETLWTSKDSFSINQTCTNTYNHKDIKETPMSSQDSSHTHQICTINHESEIMPRLIKSQGKLLNPHFNIGTNLFSFHVGETVLRTKLCQGGGYDEDIQSTIIHGVKHKLINQTELIRMDQMDLKHGYKAWDPGDGLVIYKAEDSRFQDMKTHARIIPKHPMARTPDLKLQGVFNAFRASNHLEMPPNSYIHPKESLHMPNTSLDSFHSSQSTIHQAKAENTQRLHSFSLIYGFIPQGFTGEVFNEANASHGVVLDGLGGPNTSHDQCQRVNTNQISEVLHFGDNKELSLFISKSRPWRHHEDTLARVEGLKTCFEDLWKTLVEREALKTLRFSLKSSDCILSLFGISKGEGASKRSSKSFRGTEDTCLETLLMRERLWRRGYYVLIQTFLFWTDWTV